MCAASVAESSDTLLIVDDDEPFRRSTCRLLTHHGYRCFEAANAAQARVVLDTERDISAVLCDIMMPGRSGIELLREVADDFPDLAVVMTTGVDDPDVAEIALAAGAFGYLVKPFDANELLINLSSALRRSALEASHRATVRSLEATILRTQTLRSSLDDIGSADDTIERLSRALSLRDEETGRHIERMSRYSVVLAEATGYGGLTLEDVRLATALHDVGKIGVPDGILLKPGPLSRDEYAAMQRHAQMGYQLLVGSPVELVGIAAEIALSHHEWWDGGGYPRGLVGTEIPEEARIAAVCDVFDALTSDRVYRPAMSFDEASSLMAGLRGRQFEPRLVDAFLGSMDAIVQIRDAFPDHEDSQKRIRVFVVDDHEIFTHSLVRLLATKPQVKVVGTAGSVAEAVAGALAYEPDVVLMDFELPDGEGPAATARIKALKPDVQVVMLTARTDEDAMVRAIAAGCSGFVYKDDAVDDLLDAIEATHEGETAMSSQDLSALLGRLRSTNRQLGTDLSVRELEILHLMAAGLVNKAIAQQLDVRLNTVRNHVRNILAKLQAHSKLEAVATAVREGVIRHP